MDPAVPFNHHHKGPLNSARQPCLLCVAARAMYHTPGGLRCCTCLISHSSTGWGAQIKMSSSSCSLGDNASPLQHWLWFPQVCGSFTPVSHVPDLLDRHLLSGVVSSQTIQNDLISRSSVSRKTFSPDTVTLQPNSAEHVAL